MFKLTSKLPISLILPTLLLLGSLPATAVEFSSTERQAVLIELYTSEGCSSCPPADHWLSTLKQDPRLWKQIIPIAFHVDYWNYLGWDDRFSTAANTQRQRQYSDRGYAKTVYTPGFFKNGREWRAWFRNRDLGNTEGKIVGPLKAKWENNKLYAIYTPQNPLREPLKLNVALLGMDIKNEIMGGENGGKTLLHDFVVLAIESYPAIRADKGLQWDITYSPSQILLDKKSNSQQQALAMWITQTNDPTPIQAVGGLLP